MKKLILVFTILLITINNSYYKGDYDDTKIREMVKLRLNFIPEIAPNHVKRFKTLANDGKYDGVVFHRVIDGFMAQTGDVKIW